jgi:hypothetical protein
MQNEWMMVNRRGYGRKLLWLNLKYCTSISVRSLRKITKPSVNIFDVLAEIRLAQFLVARSKHYHLSNLVP